MPLREKAYPALSELRTNHRISIGQIPPQRAIHINLGAPSDPGSVTVFTPAWAEGGKKNYIVMLLRLEFDKVDN